LASLVLLTKIEVLSLCTTSTYSGVLVVPELPKRFVHEGGAGHVKSRDTVSLVVLLWPPIASLSSSKGISSY
jgi:hypothetical protein